MWAITNVLKRSRTDYSYVNTIKALYDKAIITVQIHNFKTNDNKIKHGIKQRVTICPKLLTLENVFKTLDLDNKWRTSY